MRREDVVDAGVAAALAPLALLVALPFRAEAIARTPLTSLGWDAALHATEGLDLFDDLRLIRPLDALGLLASRHWWGPLWALVSAPLQAAFGPSLAAASLPSLVAFVLAPSVAFLLARRLAPAGAKPAEPCRLRPRALRGISSRAPARPRGRTHDIRAECAPRDRTLSALADAARDLRVAHARIPRRPARSPRVPLLRAARGAGRAAGGIPRGRRGLPPEVPFRLLRPRHARRRRAAGGDAGSAAASWSGGARPSAARRGSRDPRARGRPRGDAREARRTGGGRA